MKLYVIPVYISNDRKSVVAYDRGWNKVADAHPTMGYDIDNLREQDCFHFNEEEINELLNNIEDEHMKDVVKAAITPLDEI